MARRVSREHKIRQMYRALVRAWGAQHWWPAASRFEVIVGAFLTQNTSWRNVELALGNLRRAGVLTIAGIRALPLAKLETLVRPAGYYRQKAARLKGFVDFLDHRYRGSLAAMFAQPTKELRHELLSLSGIGPETADSILLYAGNHPVFVVDAYARRIFQRHNLVSTDADYDQMRSLVEVALGNLKPLSADGFGKLAHSPSRMSRAKRSPAAQHFNELHGLLVTAGKLHCHKQQPDCGACPLGRFLEAPPPAV
jgi:endonuclease-3 related protein